MGVQPRMGAVPGVAAGKFVKVPDGPLLSFGGLEIGAIGDGLQGADAVAIELLVTERFVIAGAVADAQAAIARQLGELFEARRVLDVGDEEVRADQADAGDGAQAWDFEERAAGLDQQAAALGLTGEGLVQKFVEDQGLRTQRVVGQLLEPEGAPGWGKDGAAGGEEAPVLEEGFELELEAGLALDGVFVSLGAAFEEDALILGGLPDRFEFVEAQEAGQGEGVAAIVLVVILTDEVVAAGVTDDELLDVGLEELAEPAGEVGFFEHEPLVGGGDGLDLGDEFLGLGGKLPPLDFGAVVVEVSEDAVFGVGIEPEPCYSGSIIHNGALVVVNVTDHLADAWRIRMCSFTESLDCSIHQVVRFSIYQQRTRHERRGCNRGVPWAGSLSLGRSAAIAQWVFCRGAR